MEAFSLLKYWRGGGSHVNPRNGLIFGSADTTLNSRATTIVSAATDNSIDTDDDEDDDGPFFDLEFAVTDDEEDEEEEEEEDDDEDKKERNGGDLKEERNDSDECDSDEDGSDEFNFTLSSGSSSNDRVDQNLELSPSDDLFFKGRLIPLEPSSILVNGSDNNSKSQFPASFLKSATKFRVFMLGFKKSSKKLDEKLPTPPPVEDTATEPNNEAAAVAVDSTEKQKQENKPAKESNNSKLFTVKFKVEEVPLVSLFTRENSKSTSKSIKQHIITEETQTTGQNVSDEKRFSKEVMQKYLKKVKPLYIRVSKHYGEKLKFSGQLSLASALKTTSASVPTPPPTAAISAQKASPEKVPEPETAEVGSALSVGRPSSTLKSLSLKPEGEPVENGGGSSLARASNNLNLKSLSLKQTGLKVVCKHLGKSRSATSALAAAAGGPVSSRRRDDSLLQQQDGIQSAILHCKRSFNAPRDSDASSLL